MSALAWARQPPGAPGHRALARLVEQRVILSTITLDPTCAAGVHPERLRKLAREGGAGLPLSTCGRCRRCAATRLWSPRCSTRLRA
jgi:hypothetical protein